MRLRQGMTVLDALSTQSSGRDDWEMGHSLLLSFQGESNVMRSAAALAEEVIKSMTFADPVKRMADGIVLKPGAKTFKALHLRAEYDLRGSPEADPVVGCKVRWHAGLLPYMIQLTLVWCLV